MSRYFMAIINYNRITMGFDPAVRKQEGELLPLMISTCILLRYWHQALKKLFDHIASSALHNSSESYDRGKCHPGTRKSVLDKILQWAKNPNNLRLLMWIFGPAGAGKSSIMQSIAELLARDRILGGSFFFFRTGEKRNTKKHLVTTLAYQLAQNVPQYGEHIAAAVHNNHSIFSLTLEAQMKDLIIDPITAAISSNPDLSTLRYLILVDGLDECSPVESQCEIVSLLFYLASSSPFRILIASRPEFTIRDSFNFQTVRDQTETLALSNTYEANADIEQYLTDKLNDIKTKSPFR